MLRMWVTDVEDHNAAAENCFAAAGIYAVFVVGTSICILRSNKLQRDARRDSESLGTGSEMSGISKDARFGFGAGAGGGGGEYGRQDYFGFFFLPLPYCARNNYMFITSAHSWSLSLVSIAASLVPDWALEPPDLLCRIGLC